MLNPFLILGNRSYFSEIGEIGLGIGVKFRVFYLLVYLVKIESKKALAKLFCERFSYLSIIVAEGEFVLLV